MEDRMIILDKEEVMQVKWVMKAMPAKRDAENRPALACVNVVGGDAGEMQCTDGCRIHVWRWAVKSNLRMLADGLYDFRFEGKVLIATPIDPTVLNLHYPDVYLVTSLSHLKIEYDDPERFTQLTDDTQATQVGIKVVEPAVYMSFDAGFFADAISGMGDHAYMRMGRTMICTHKMELDCGGKAFAVVMPLWSDIVPAGCAVHGNKYTFTDKIPNLFADIPRK